MHHTPTGTTTPNPTPTTAERIAQAIDAYTAAVGDGALQPSRELCEITGKNMVILRNVNGLLAVVSAHGVVQSRIGGDQIGGAQ